MCQLDFMETMTRWDEGMLYRRRKMSERGLEIVVVWTRRHAIEGKGNCLCIFDNYLVIYL
jgi:hypothetical protein